MANFLDRELCDPTDSCNPETLASRMIKFELSHNTKFIQDHPPSSQGQAYAAATTPPPKKDKLPKSSPKNPQTQGDPNKPHCPICRLETGVIWNNHGHSDKNKCSRAIASSKTPLTQFNRAYAAPVTTTTPLLDPSHHQAPAYASYPVPHYYQQGVSPSPTSQSPPNSNQPPHPTSYLSQQAMTSHPSSPQIVYQPNPSPPHPTPHQLSPTFPSAYFTQAPPQHHHPTPSPSPYPQTHSPHQPSAYMTHHSPASLPSPFEAAARALCVDLKTADPSETTTALFATLLDNFERST